MHKNFGEWYRLVALEPDGARLQKRWAGVEAWARELRNDDKAVLETVRTFQGRPSKASRDAFLATFQKEDPAFPQRNEMELQVLAGSSLVACVEAVGADGEGVRTAVLAGAALEASSLCTMEAGLAEVAREVAEGLEAIAVQQRARKPLNPNAVEGKADAAAEAMEQISTIADWNVHKRVTSTIFQALVDAVRAANIELSRVAHNLRSADEETNILWWVEGGCSRDINKPWAALKEGAAIVAGAELADLTEIALGPRNAAALLERVLSESKHEGKNSPLAAYVNALPDEWARGRAAKVDHAALDLTPLMLAVVHRGTSDTQSWQQYFDASSGVKSSTELTVARVARQAYVEAILLRALGEGDTED